jgi:hypothetical protein
MDAQKSQGATGRWPERVARLIVLDMVLWPGALFVLSTMFIAYQVRDVPLMWPLLAAATTLSVAVGIRQYGTMLRAVATPHQWSLRDSRNHGEDSPGLTTRGITEDHVLTTED